MKNYFGTLIKKLGFGFMRLPEIAGQFGKIDIELVKRMVDLYIERGFTYFDTAFVYHGGNSEVAIREAVTERYARSAFQVTTKLPLWGPMTPDEMKDRTKTSLERAGLDYFDLYFLHGIGPERIEMIDSMKAWDYLQSVKDSGKAKNIGFSYHGDGDGLSRILDDHAKDIDIIQLQINYLDWEDERVQSRKCYEAAVAHGVGIIVMEPVKGGALSNFTPSVAEYFKKADPDASIASWALRFPMHLDGVITVLSGMSSYEQVDDNTKTADSKGKLSDAEMDVIHAAIAEMKKLPLIPCTACRYCVDDCPKKINTPAILALLNDQTKYDNIPIVKHSYFMATSGFFGGSPAKSSDCIACGSCEQHCPQGIEIIKAHQKAAQLFE